MIPSEEIISRYRETVKIDDALGRLITVGRLRMSQQVKVGEWTPGLEGETQLRTPDGGEVTVSRRLLPMLAAMVREIDGAHIPFPRSRAELDSVMDRLDEAGIAAVVRGVAKLEGTVSDE